jgi:hypothetical protein
MFGIMHITPGPPPPPTGRVYYVYFPMLFREKRWKKENKKRGK